MINLSLSERISDVKFCLFHIQLKQLLSSLHSAYFYKRVPPSKETGRPTVHPLTWLSIRLAVPDQN